MSEALFDVFAAGAAAQAGALHGFESVDWLRAVQDTARHQCAPMFGRRLRELGILDRVPAEERQRLIGLARTTAVRNLGSTLQLRELTDRLLGTPMIALKGACLARTCYRDLSLRPMLDLDLFAQVSDLDFVRGVLAQLGYRQSQRVAPETNPMHDPPYFKPGSIPIELHRSILDRNDLFCIDHEALWSRAVPAGDIAGLSYLGAEDRLLHVCLHAGYHHQLDIGLYAFIDIAMIVRGTALDWRTFVDRAREWRAERCVFLTLEMARVLVGAEVPAEVLAALRPADFDSDILRAAIDVVRHHHPRGYQPTGIVSEIIVDVLFGHGWRSIPGRFHRRFLRTPERRTQWRGSSDGVGWYAQVAPLLRGLAALARSRPDREQLRARWHGARLQRWMTRAGAVRARHMP